MLVLLATFAAGTVLESATAASMTAQMTLAKSGAMNGTDCDACPDDGRDTPDCNSACIAPAFAMFDTVSTPEPVVEVTTADVIVLGITGRTGAPEPGPPRADILN